MKTLEYPMNATKISETESDFIMGPIREFGLPKAEACSKFPWTLLYGSKICQGIELMLRYYAHKLEHIAICIYEGERHIITCELIRASLEQLKLKVGKPERAYEQESRRSRPSRPTVG
jgi:hypothetical protein